MEKYLSASDKFDLQQNYRRFLKYQEQFSFANESLKEARASRVWVVGLITLLFALASDFFLVSELSGGRGARADGALVCR
jgi:hypothetical protein